MTTLEQTIKHFDLVKAAQDSYIAQNVSPLNNILNIIKRYIKGLTLEDIAATQGDHYPGPDDNVYPDQIYLESLQEIKDLELKYIDQCIFGINSYDIEHIKTYKVRKNNMSITDEFVENQYPHYGPKKLEEYIEYILAHI